MTNKGLVFNIQRYSVHDGAGIRTIIFLKGCPLRCPWCANPESRKAVAPVTWRKNGKDETVGEWRSVPELVDEVLKDEIFFRTSGGGVTLSGGEVLMQADFAQALLREFRELGVHTAIETTGCFPVAELQKLTPYLDEVLFDLKIMDPELSKQVIGADVQQVQANFEYLLTQEQVTVTPRIPLIPGYTAQWDNIEAIITYLRSLGVEAVHLLPFHQYGSKKYEYLGWTYEMQETPTLQAQELAAIKDRFLKENLNATVDGL